MIELYAPHSNNYDINGEIVLAPSTCEITFDLESTWILDLAHPIDDDGRWKHIVENAVIKAPSPYGPQLYRITKINKIDDEINATAKPIFLDCQNEVMLFDVRPTKRNGQSALDYIFKDTTKYSGESDIEDIRTAFYVLKNAGEALFSADNAFTKVWGGEVVFDNFKVIINKKIGLDRGLTFLYGKNIKQNGIRETVTIDNVVTRIIPKSYNGYTLDGDEPWVDSPLIDKYPIIRTKVIEFKNIKLRADAEEFGSDDDPDAILCDTKRELDIRLKMAARAKFEEENVDKPEVSLTINIIALKQTEEYKDIPHIDDMLLGDIVYCKHDKLDIESTARITELIWDCIRERPVSIQVGDVTKSFVYRVSESVSSTEKALTKNGTVKADKISGLIDLGSAQLTHQNTIAKHQDVMAILFEDTNPNSLSYGALAIGTQGLQISRELDKTTKEWTWKTAITAAGVTADALIAQERLEVAKNFFVGDDGYIHITETEYNYDVGNNILIDSDGVKIRKDKSIVASFGKTFRIGRLDGQNIYIDQDSIDVRNGTTVEATFGRKTRIGRPGQARIELTNDFALYNSNNIQAIYMGTEELFDDLYPYILIGSTKQSAVQMKIDSFGFSLDANKERYARPTVAYLKGSIEELTFPEGFHHYSTNFLLGGLEFFSDYTTDTSGTSTGSYNTMSVSDFLEIPINITGTPSVRRSISLDGLDGITINNGTSNIASLDWDGNLQVKGSNFTSNKQLTITRVENSYVNATAIGRLYAYEKSGFLWFNGNIQVTTAMPSGATSDFLEIAMIDGWSSQVACYGMVAMQNGSGTMAVTITSNGSLRIYNGSGSTISGFGRLSLCVPKA